MSIKPFFTNNFIDIVLFIIEIRYVFFKDNFLTYIIKPRKFMEKSFHPQHNNTQTFIGH
jgi:hypothetical protein